MIYRNVLIVGQPSEHLDVLLDIIYLSGYHPVIRNSLERLTSVIQKHGFCFIVVLCDRNAVDSIETVLTIRDYEISNPVIVVDTSPDAQISRVLNDLMNVFYVPFEKREIIHVLESMK